MMMIDEVVGSNYDVNTRLQVCVERLNMHVGIICL